MFKKVLLSVVLTGFLFQPAYAEDWVDILKPLVKDVVVPVAKMGLEKLREKKKDRQKSINPDEPEIITIDPIEENWEEVPPTENVWEEFLPPPSSLTD